MDEAQSLLVGLSHEEGHEHALQSLDSFVQLWIQFEDHEILTLFQSRVQGTTSWTLRALTTILHQSFSNLIFSSATETSSEALALFTTFIDRLSTFKCLDAILIAESFLQGLLKELNSRQKSAKGPAALEVIINTYSLCIRALPCTYSGHKSQKIRLLRSPFGFLKTIINPVVQLGLATKEIRGACCSALVLFNSIFQIHPGLEAIQMYCSAIHDMFDDEEERLDLNKLLGKDKSVIKNLVISFLNHYASLNKNRVVSETIVKYLICRKCQSIIDWLLEAVCKRSSSRKVEHNTLRIFCVRMVGYHLIEHKQIQTVLLSLLDDPIFKVRSQACKSLALISFHSVKSKHTPEKCIKAQGDKLRFPFSSLLSYATQWDKSSVREVESYGIWAFYITRHMFLECTLLVNSGYPLQIISKLARLLDCDALIQLYIIWGVLLGSSRSRAPLTVPPCDPSVLKTFLENLSHLRYSCEAGVSEKVLDVCRFLISGQGIPDYKRLREIYRIVGTRADGQSLREYGQIYHTICLDERIPDNELGEETYDCKEGQKDVSREVLMERYFTSVLENSKDSIQVEDDNLSLHNLSPTNLSRNIDRLENQIKKLSENVEALSQSPNIVESRSKISLSPKKLSENVEVLSQTPNIIRSRPKISLSPILLYPTDLSPTYSPKVYEKELCFEDIYDVNDELESFAMEPISMPNMSQMVEKTFDYSRLAPAQIVIPFMKQSLSRQITALLSYLNFSLNPDLVNYSEVLLITSGIYKNIRPKVVSTTVTALHPILKEAILLDIHLLIELTQDLTFPSIIATPTSTSLSAWMEGLYSLHRHLQPLSKSLRELEKAVRNNLTAAQAIVVVRDRISLIRLTVGNIVLDDNEKSRIAASMVVLNDSLLEWMKAIN